MNSGRSPFSLLVVLCLTALMLRSFAQTETATISGRVTDQQGAILVGAEISVTNIETNIGYHQTTNREGLYVLSGVKPGRYRITVRNAGFRTINLADVILNVQDSISQNFKLQVGSVSESITIVADEAKLNTESATVSTVVDRQFAENLPMNGRSFQTLVQLTPGVVLSPGSSYEQGQFNVNGQRGYSNYWMIDGVGANIGISTFAAGTAAGGLQGSSAQGGTNSLVSVDAMQEFRIQTSTYAPEFGRTPGAQISIATRSGTNQFRGEVFDYFRNDILDSNDWFNGYTNNPAIRKPEERQNDFGGTIGGPILRNRTFFFFSYEGLRLRQPRVIQVTVPSLSARQAAVTAVRPFFDGFPLPNGPDLANGTAIFNDSHSNRANLDAVSLRVDHKITDKTSVFARVNYSPSVLTALQGSVLLPIHSRTETSTIGVSWAISSATLNDFRINLSRNEAKDSTGFVAVGGAVAPPFASLLPPPFTLQNSGVGFTIGGGEFILAGPSANNVQRQVNVVDSFSISHRLHDLKFGIDFRRLTPTLGNEAYREGNNFTDSGSAEAGVLCGRCFFASTASNAYLLFRNLGVYAQDTWRVLPRLTFTYGLRWDTDFPPSTTRNPKIAATSSCCNLANVALAPVGTPVFATQYGNIAPRIGAAYQVRQRDKWVTVLRGGFGIFYDLATSETSSMVMPSFYPFGSTLNTGGNFPIPFSQAVPPPTSPSSLASGVLVAFDPHLRLPYTREWNAAIQQELGTGRTLSVSYIGSAGRNLTQSEFGLANSRILLASLVTNPGTSDYDALQVEFQQRLTKRLQLLTSYTWAHSIDTASASSFGTLSNYYSAQFGARLNRGPSDFDIRNAFTAGLTYAVPTPSRNAVVSAVLKSWSVHTIIQARSALPVNVDDTAVSSAIVGGQAFADIRPDVVKGEPIYLAGPQYPGGKAFNPAAFVLPPIDPDTGLPVRQGNLGRNALRGFGSTQWDFAIHRLFPIREHVNLEFRAEMFNIPNHPNFGPPVGDLSSPQFGLSTQTWANALSGTGSSLSPLYQVGGPRSIQLALKLTF